MKNKGFTLAELLAVIVILGLVAVIAVPAVTKTLGGTKAELCEDQLKNIKEAARLYGSDHMLELPDSEGETKTITLQDLQMGGYIKENLENPKNKQVIDSSLLIKITKQGQNKWKYEVEDFCNS